MEIIIKQDDKGNDIGYTIKRGESDKDKDAINRMRNLIFFGMDETHIKYDGRTGENNQVDTLKFIQKQHKKY